MQNSSIDLPQEQIVQKWQKIIIFSMIATAFLTLWASLYVPISDGDIWFHLLYGKAILENHTLTPDHTIYSWTPSSNEGIYCAWIGQILYYLVYEYFGNGGVIVLRYLSASTLFIAILLLSRQRNTFYNPITWFTALLCTLIISQVALDKPEILSFTFMALIVWNWYKIKKIRQNVLYQIYLFPLLILIWVNTHGAFFYGCLFLLCVGLGETINQFIYRQNALPRRLYYHLILALFLSAGCTLITPYGYDYILQLVTQYFDKQLQSDFSQVHAYKSTFEMRNNPQLPVFADTAVVLILLVFSISLRKRQLDFVPIISNLLFAFLFTRHGRLILPWISVFSLSIVYYGSAVSVMRTRRKVLYFSALALASFCMSGWFLHHEKLHPTRGQWLEFGVSELFTIDEEINFIDENYKNAKLGNTYDHGAYILWKRWPQTKVMMDSRYFPYKDWFNEYFAFHSGIIVEKFIQKYPFDVIAIKHNYTKLIYWFHRSEDWKLVFYGKSAAVFVRSTLALPCQITRGISLDNISTLSVASGVFHTSILIRDWQGADIVLNTMKRNFTHQHRQKTISGFIEIKQAAQKFEQKDYTATVRYMEKASDNQVFDYDLYASSLLMKAIEDWQDRQWDSAIKDTIKSLLTKNSFAARYNLALMVWQIETMEQYGQKNFQLSLTEQEIEITAEWRTLLAMLAHNNKQYSPQYDKYIENARKILNGDKDCKTQFVVSDYQ